MVGNCANEGYLRVKITIFGAEKSSVTLSVDSRYMYWPTRMQTREDKEVANETHAHEKPVAM